VALKKKGVEISKSSSCLLMCVGDQFYCGEKPKFYRCEEQNLQNIQSWCTLSEKEQRGDIPKYLEGLPEVDLCGFRNW